LAATSVETIQLEEPKSESELLQDAIVCEMYYAFSGFFKPGDCARALKYNNDDIEQAATWLVNEKDKSKSDIEIKRVSSTILYESELVNDPLQPET
jgi:uncharacterized UBP type Zn finger protein